MLSLGGSHDHRCRHWGDGPPPGLEAPVPGPAYGSGEVRHPDRIRCYFYSSRSLRGRVAYSFENEGSALGPSSACPRHPQPTRAQILVNKKLSATKTTGAV